jgi:hypothetical protein
VTDESCHHPCVENTQERQHHIELTLSAWRGAGLRRDLNDATRHYEAMLDVPDYCPRHGFWQSPSTPPVERLVTDRQELIDDLVGFWQIRPKGYLDDEAAENWLVKHGFLEERPRPASAHIVVDALVYSAARKTLKMRQAWAGNVANSAVPYPDIQSHLRDDEHVVLARWGDDGMVVYLADKDTTYHGQQAGKIYRQLYYLQFTPGYDEIPTFFVGGSDE